MGISIFPSTAAEFVSNNFVVDMNDTSNNTADTGGVKQAGPYSMSFSSGDTSFDVYLIDEDGNSVGYSNETSITASGLFSSVVILGAASNEIISFSYQGSVNNADGEGDEPGAGAYLESISPSDLPTIDDTATVIGGNFGADTEIFFDSGASSLPAKNITVNNSSELIVTRPDSLIQDDAPYNLRAVTAGVPEPTGTNVNILTDAVTAGTDPTWVTGADLPDGEKDVAYVGATLEATDAEGTVTDYSVVSGSLPTGLSLDSSTGVISGTPTSRGGTFVVRATDDGGNSTDKEFGLAVTGFATGGTITTSGGGVIHSFTSSGTFTPNVELTDVSYVVVGGGGGGGESDGSFNFPPGGGGGGLITSFPDDPGALSRVTVPANAQTITVGNTGAKESNGNDSSFSNFGTAIGGGKGPGNFNASGGSGGSGGGGLGDSAGGIGNQGGNGGAGGGLFDFNAYGGGGGGGGPTGENGNTLSQQPGLGGLSQATNIRGNSERLANGGDAANSVSNDGGDGEGGIVIIRY